ncbi:MAG: MFS transporter [Chloroflexota bacterium]
MLEPSTAGDSRKRIWGLNPNVFFLGIVSLLTDISSEMIFTLLPLFLSNVLGATTTIVGLVGGISESSDAIFRIFSGWFSDRLGKRKLLALSGYGLSTLVKPFMLLASTWAAVLAVRFGDRVGKGLRASPRDAMIADSVSAKERGRGFGLHRAMDTLGATIGLGLAAVIIYLVQGGGLELSLKSYRWLVLAGIVPAVLAVLVLFLFVRERKRTSLPASGPRPRPGWSGLTGGFDARFKLFLVVMGVFTLGNSSDFFVILRGQNLGVPLVQVVLMVVLLNVTYAAVSLPAGMLSDRLGRRKVIVLGWLIYVLVYLGFALSSSLWQVWLLFAGYGVYYGITEGVARALVADLVVPEKRGTAYGLYHGVVGFALLFASLIAGWLWQTLGRRFPFTSVPAWPSWP